MDESNQQLIGEVRKPLPARPGSCKKVDDEYVRNGVADIFMSVEPLAGRRMVSLTRRRARVDWARFVRGIVDGYPDAEKVVLVMDNLNTHGTGSLYEAFPPEEARRIASKLEIHYTPKHGSWLNIAEIELSALKRQCLSVRIATFEEMEESVSAWEKERNGKCCKVDWQFTTDDARIKLRRLYPVYKQN